MNRAMNMIMLHTISTTVVVRARSQSQLQSAQNVSEYEASPTTGSGSHSGSLPAACGTGVWRVGGSCTA